MKRYEIIASMLAVLCLLATAVLAAPPSMVNYQGTLTDGTGNPLMGTHELTFNIYAYETGGDPLWTETHREVLLNMGIFNVMLGQWESLLPDLFEGSWRWIGISVDEGAEMIPRMRMTSVPWALRAAVADSAATSGSADTDWILSGDNMYSGVSGNVGIGRTVPTEMLHLDTHNTGGGIKINYGTNYGNLYGEFKQMGSGGLVINSNAGGTWADISFQTNSTTKMFLDSYGRLGIGTTSPTRALHVEGEAQVDVLHIMGADVAEKFPVDEMLEPGTVVAIDDQSEGRLCRSRQAYDRKVAGVVSGAGDLPTGAVLGNLPDQGLVSPIALSGRVWVHCDASDHPIHLGDMLTTSDRPGYAMKASDSSRSHGAIIGKAMTSLDEGQGLVLVLVNLQ
jgi:hypothetical protein